MRIGVVDDDEATIAFITQVLSGKGHVCKSYKRSADIIPALRDDTFDLLILDWNMPGLSGIDIIAWARDKISPCPPIIMLTSRSDGALSRMASCAVALLVAKAQRSKPAK